MQKATLRWIYATGRDCRRWTVPFHTTVYIAEAVTSLVAAQLMFWTEG